MVFETFEDPSAPEMAELEKFMKHYYEKETPSPPGMCQAGIALKDATGSLAGGVKLWHWFGWSYIHSLYVRPDLRRQGWGRKLMEAAETKAVSWGCRRLYLGTFSFQQPSLYLKCGFKVVGEIPEFPGDHKLIYMSKVLA